MVTLDEFVKRMGRLNKFILKRSKEILKENQDLIVKMVQDQQHEGIGADGQKMQTKYSAGYTKKRKKAGLQTSFVDLHFSGKMHKGFKVRSAKGGVDVRSREPYEFYVRANFPKGFSLTKENAEIVGNLLADKLAPEIKQFLVK